MMAAATTIRVMLIDDHKTMLWGLERLIEGKNTGMQVVASATTAKEALEKILSAVPDVILLDLDLDGKSALEILPALLENGVSRVVVFTGSRDQKILDSAVLGGAHGVLHKEASADIVLKAIQRVHGGELWLDKERLCRVLGEFMHPGEHQLHDPETEKQASLTAKERTIINLIVEGRGTLNKSLAERLFISEHTLRNHLWSIYKKLGVSNRLELYVYATKHQLKK